MGFIERFASSGIEIGVVKGATPGHLGVFAVWDPAKEPKEVYRVVVSAQSPVHPPVSAFSYTFGPAHEKPFVQSVETPLELKEFLVGFDRATEGTVTFEFLLSENQLLSKAYQLQDIVRSLRGKGPDAPERAERLSGYLTKDTPEIANLKHSELKAYSAKIKAELEEKRRQEEEARKKKEAEAAAAAAKAAEAAKAAQAKPAAAAPAPGAEGVDRSKPTIAACKAAIFYGSSTGNTKNVADQIKSEIGDSIVHVKNITDCHPVDLTVPEVVILGIPTWHIGELQDDWAAVMPEISALNYSGKKVAIFGLGDQKGYPDTYVDAMMELWEPFQKTGATLHGLWPTDGYDFKKSKALKDGKFLGVVIDVENQDHLSDKRVKAWCQQLRSELGL